jgi:hypothetical protein
MYWILCYLSMRYELILINFSSLEFTHRVKSISMAKFNAEEVSALQAGGNEVVHEIEYYLIANDLSKFC